MNILDYTEVKDYIRIKLVSANADTANSLTRPFLDMVETFYVDLNGKAAIISPELASLWQKNADELHRDAVINEENDYTYMSMGEILFGTEDDAPGMMVLSNSSKVFGAGVITSAKVLTKAAERFGEDIFIIPSSIHEVIVMPVSITDAGTLASMIRDVNCQEVSPEDQLGDHAYLFSLKDRTLKSAKEE